MQTVLPFTARCYSSCYLPIAANEPEVSPIGLLSRWRKRWKKHIRTHTVFYRYVSVCIMFTEGRWVVNLTTSVSLNRVILYQCKVVCIASGMNSFLSLSLTSSLCTRGELNHWERYFKHMHLCPYHKHSQDEHSHHVCPSKTNNYKTQSKNSRKRQYFNNNL